MQQFWVHFLNNLHETSLLEYIAVFTGIASVWFSRKENIWVYPVGLISTIIYIYLSFKYDLPGEASVNLYYTVMSIYGWILWAKKDTTNHHILSISFSDAREWMKQIAFFLFFFIAVYFSEVSLKNYFGNVIPWADGFATATAFTGMWLMAKKKVESWYWWIATNIASIPLYFVKGLAFTSVFYFVLLVMAFWGLAEWKRKATIQNNQKFELEKA
jgi:nicotinamide mononucleotide transporter